jgi:predicted esterase
MKQLYKSCQAAMFCLALLFFTPGLLFSQSKRTLTAHPGTVVDSFIHGFYTSLPASYSTGTKKYPLLIFLHGQGEVGNGSASALPAVLRNGPPMQINQQVNNNVNANFPDPVTVNGQSFEFIVVAPQLNTWPWNTYEQVAVNDMISYAIRNYRVDTSKIYLTGLSMGGGIAWEYPGFSAALYGKRIAGLLVVAGASTPVIQRADEIVKAHVPVWATANAVDNTVPTAYTTGYIQLLNQEGANPAPLITIFPDQGHGGWLKTYGAPNQPGVVQNGLNVYQWMLQYKRQGDNVIIDKGSTAPTLTANAGADQTVTLPNRATLTGSAQATNSTITSYKWAQVSGPATAYFVNSNAAQTQAVGLVAGTYVFKLTATGSTGLTASDQITVTAVASAAPTLTVNAGADQTVTLPSRSTLTGSATATNSTITSYKWAQISGPAIAYFLNSNAAQTQAVGLVTGTYVFRLTATGSTGLTASDQITVTTRTATAAAAVSTGETSALSLGDSTDDAGRTVKLYPNPVPVDQQFAVEGQGWKAGTLKFLIYDISGKMMKQVVLENQPGYFRQTIPATGLAKGSYVLAIMAEGEKPKTFKLLIE